MRETNEDDGRGKHQQSTIQMFEDAAVIPCILDWFASPSETEGSLNFYSIPKPLPQRAALQAHPSTSNLSSVGDRMQVFMLIYQSTLLTELRLKSTETRYLHAN